MAVRAAVKECEVVQQEKECAQPKLNGDAGDWIAEELVAQRTIQRQAGLQQQKEHKLRNVGGGPRSLQPWRREARLQRVLTQILWMRRFVFFSSSWRYASTGTNCDIHRLIVMHIRVLKVGGIDGARLTHLHVHITHI